MTERGRASKLRSNLTLSLISIVMVGLLLEGITAAALAITDWQWSLTLGSGQPHLAYDVERQWKLKRSFDGPTITTNARGFRAPELPVPKPAGTFRILALGDSITFGTYDCPELYCPIERSYPYQLEQILAVLGHTQVVNAGTEGYNSDKSLAWATSSGFDYSPDLVILMVGWNDVLESRLLGPASESPPAQGLFRWLDTELRQWSHVYRFAWLGGKALGRGRAIDLGPASTGAAGVVPAKIDIDPAKIIRYEDNLRSLVRRAHERGARVVLMTLAGAIGPDLGVLRASDVAAIRSRYGWPDLARLAAEVQRYNAVVRKVAAAETAGLVDFEGIVERAGGTSLFALPDINHPISTAIPTLVREIAAALAAQSISPPKSR